MEAQHTASTMRLVESITEQSVLETVLEESKPKPASGTEPLHYLLATPFRYHPREGSRFRAAFEGGVWYGAEELRTALAEKSYWQLRFLLDSPGTPDLRPVPHTAFTAAVRGRAIDLMTTPFARDRARWTHRSDYVATQALAAKARHAKVELIRYESIRDPQRGACAAVLNVAAFHRSKPRQLQTWFIAASRAGVRCAQNVRNGPTWEFTRKQLM